jgi:hypothetical protein
MSVSLRTAYAAKRGDLERLKELIESGARPDNGETTKQASNHGHYECLKYAYEHGFVMRQGVTSFARNLACLQFAYEHGCPWDEMTTANAAQRGSLDCLIYAHEHGCPWSSSTTRSAAGSGNMDCLIYAITHGCAVDDRALVSAASNGKLECMKYLHEHGVPWTGMAFYKSPCTEAAKHGHLDCLKYAHEHGCPLQTLYTNVIYDASANKHTECLIYSLEIVDDLHTVITRPVTNYHHSYSAHTLLHKLIITIHMITSGLPPLDFRLGQTGFRYKDVTELLSSNYARYIVSKKHILSTSPFFDLVDLMEEIIESEDRLYINYLSCIPKQVIQHVVLPYLETPGLMYHTYSNNHPTDTVFDSDDA